MLSLLDSIGGLSSLSSKLKTSMLALLARRTPAELGELPLSLEEDFFITHRAIKLEFIDLEESVINRTVHKSENGGPAQFSPKLFVLIFQVQTFNFDWNFILWIFRILNLEIFRRKSILIKTNQIIRERWKSIKLWLLAHLLLKVKTRDTATKNECNKCNCSKNECNRNECDKKKTQTRNTT